MTSYKTIKVEKLADDSRVVRETSPPLWTVRAGIAGGIAIIFIWVALAIAVRAKNPSRLP
jgi:hypothetical protein